MTAESVTLIVGAGHAGLQAAASLREQKYDGRVILVGDDPSLPYHRPPLSKAYIASEGKPEAPLIRSARFFSDHDIDVRTGERIVSIDPSRRTAIGASGVSFSYDHLVLATGSGNRRLQLAGHDLDGVHYLRSIEEAAVFRRGLAVANSLVVIGGGFVGLEVAAVARGKGVATTVIEVGDRLLARAVSRPMSEFVHSLHERLGVSIRYRTAARAIVGENGAVTGVLLETGELIKADQVLVGIGAIPNTDLARAAKLSVADGIVVDQFLTTSDPNISAIGDCARFPISGGSVRFESVQNATDQGRAVGAKLAGRPSPYAAVPWFWSDQGDAKLQIAGDISGHDDCLISREAEDKSFSVLCFRQGVLAGVESLNRAGDHMAARRLLQSRRSITRAELADANFDLKTLASKVAKDASGQVA